MPLKLTRARRQQLVEILKSDAGMARMLDALYGPAGWRYHPDLDLWTVENTDPLGNVRRVIVWKRGGVSFEISPHEPLQP